MAHPSGILNLNKPSGLTSRQAVDVVARLVRPAKAGHAGTLDPLARGVLVVCVGKATRLISYVQQQPKRYRATFVLGCRSDTEDIEGHVVELPDAPRPEYDRLCEAAERFVGEIQQRPPAYSALKVGGKRAYKLARAGRPVELKSRPVHIYELQVLDYAYPQVRLEIACSAGTYVRSLGRDLAESLGTAAVMSGLERTAVGPFRVGEALAPEALNDLNWPLALRPMLEAVADLPRVEVSEAQRECLGRGQTIAAPNDLPGADEFAAVDTSGQLLGILGWRGPSRLRPLKNLR